MAAPALVLKAAASILANEKSRKAVGWVLICGQPAVSSEVPKNTMQAMGGMS